jgi:hypothetical protein
MERYEKSMSLVLNSDLFLSLSLAYACRTTPTTHRSTTSTRLLYSRTSYASYRLRDNREYHLHFPRRSCHAATESRFLPQNISANAPSGPGASLSHSAASAFIFAYKRSQGCATHLPHVSRRPVQLHPAKMLPPSRNLRKNLTKPSFLIPHCLHFFLLINKYVQYI